MPSEIIYRLREELESKDSAQSGGLAILVEGAGMKCYTRLNAIGEWYKATPRVDLKVNIGDATGHRFVCPDGGLRFDMFHFELGLQVVTRPRNISGQNELHEQMCSTLRNLMSNVGGNESVADLANFPNVYIAEFLKDSGVSDSAVDEKDNLEYTTFPAIAGLSVFVKVLGITKTTNKTNKQNER